MKYAISSGHKPIVVQVAAPWRLAPDLERAYGMYDVNLRVIKRFREEGVQVLDIKPQELVRAIIREVTQGSTVSCLRMKPMKLGYFGIMSLYMTALAAASTATGQITLALLADLGMVVAQFLALWGYERRNSLALLSGIAFGLLLLPSILAALSLGVVLNSVLIVPAALLQLDFGLKRIRDQPELVRQPI